MGLFGIIKSIGANKKAKHDEAQADQRSAREAEARANAHLASFGVPPPGMEHDARSAALNDLAGSPGDMSRTTASAFAPQQAAPPQAPINPDEDDMTARTRTAFGRAPVRPY